MTPDERIRLRRYEQWLSENQTELQGFYGKALGQAIADVGLYAMPDGIHAQVSCSNGQSFDFLLAGIEIEPVVHEFVLGKEE